MPHLAGVNVIVRCKSSGARGLLRQRIHSYSLSMYISSIDKRQHQLEVFSVLFNQRIQDQAAGENQQRKQCHKAGCHKGWKSRDQACCVEFNKDRNQKEQCNHHEYGSNDRKKREGLIVFEHPSYCAQNLEPIGEGVQLGYASLRSVPIANRDGGQCQVLVQGMDRHLGLNFKTLGQDGKALYKQTAECPITGHNIGHVAMENAVYELTDEHIPGIMERAFVFRKIG